jgi:hypothetical protein
MGNIVDIADVKILEGITSAEHDDLLDLLVSRLEREFSTAIGQELWQQTYTDIKYTGDDSVYLKLRHYPLTTLTAIAIDDEGAITIGDGTNDILLTLVDGRKWTRRYPLNITATYDAGYSPSTIEAGIGDVWSLLVDSTSQLFHDQERRKRGVASESMMSGSVSYFNEGNRDSKWYRERWTPIVSRYRRRSSAVAQAGGP